MATTRSVARIPRDADDVWSVISDAAAFANWAPAATWSRMEGSTRLVGARSGLTFTEDVITNDAELHRFQYVLTGPMRPEHHLTTVDVHPLGPGDCLLVYSTEVTPAPMLYLLGGFIDEAVTNLARGLADGVDFLDPPAPASPDEAAARLQERA